MTDATKNYFLLGGFDPPHVVHFDLARQAVEHFGLSKRNPLTLAVGFPSKGYLIERELAARLMEVSLPTDLRGYVVADVLTAKDIVQAEGKIFVHGYRHKLTGELDPHNTVEFEIKLKNLLQEARDTGKELITPKVTYFFPQPLPTNPYFTSPDQIISTEIRGNLFSKAPDFDKLRDAMPKPVADALITVRRAVDISDDATAVWLNNKMSGERPVSVIEFNHKLRSLAC